MYDLEHVFSRNHQYYDRVFYDYREGKYYDRACDVYLTLDQAHAFGIPR